MHSILSDFNNRAHIRRNEFKQINWLPVSNCFKQIISSMSFKFCNNTSPPYVSDVFKPAGQPNTITRESLLKLSQPLQRTNNGQINISYIAPLIWNNLPNSLKTITILRLIHFYFLLSFRSSLQEHFQNYIFFFFSL